MAYFKLIQFGGIAPQVSPRLLEDTLAQTASNVNLESQRLTPITDDTVTNPKADVTTLSNSNRQSIYKYTDTQWLQFDDDVDVVPGPIAGDTKQHCLLDWSRFSTHGQKQPNHRGNCIP